MISNMEEVLGKYMSVRIYKDNLRQPLFRTLLFTDLVIFIFIGTAIAGITYMLFRMTFGGNFNFLSYLFMLGILEPTFIIIATLKIDNQQIYKILSRAILFWFSQKQFRGNQLNAYYKDFTIQDDLIMRKKSISKMFRINPYDISALNASDRVSFFTNLKQSLHILPTQLQVIVQKEVATKEDFTDHLFSVYKSLPKRHKQKEQMVANYQEDFLSFVESQNLLTIKQYGVFSVPVDTTNVTAKVKAVGKLEDMYKRLSSSLEECHVSTTQMKNIELEAYMRRLLR